MTDPKRTAKEQRVETANAFLRIISEHGRRFFKHEGRVSRFEIGRGGHVFLVDKYTQRRVYTHYYRWRGFTDGGTLQSLCKALAEFIAGRADLPLSHLGPWPDWVCGGDLWGYGDDMAEVRRRCRELSEGCDD